MDENTVQETVSATTNAVAATSKVMKKDKIIVGALFAATDNNSNTKHGR